MKLSDEEYERRFNIIKNKVIQSEYMETKQVGDDYIYTFDDISINICYKFNGYGQVRHIPSGAFLFRIKNVDKFENEVLDEKLIQIQEKFFKKDKSK